ncbi:transporter, major facilitator family protein [Marvinbryantia formatexigens DSM 14469]|uniref:Transporter, major facilitator family protein n=2 Tax=Marvinbryantia TaxID=248744 RepID=C6LJF9_9FIRM|nr:transporter, major facilitator family protein [Marvinbryantia formatexigens DSM 14469]
MGKGGRLLPLSHKILLIFNAISVGIIVPVLTLIFFQHGGSSETLWAIMGAYSVSVVILEIPSGMIADFIGRKKVFVLSHILSLISFFLIINSNSLWLLIIAVIFLGASRAFASGSVEALEVELFIKKNGVEKLDTINNILSIIDSVGTFLGAALGGFLGYLDNTYTILLILLIISEIIIIFFSMAVIHETNTSVVYRLETSLWKRLKANLLLVIAEIKNTRIVLNIVLMSLVLGISLSTIETYWQSTFIRYISPQKNWLLGIISCSAYIGVGLGSSVGKYCFNLLKKHRKYAKISYYFTRVLLPVSLMGIYICKNGIWFAVNYFVMYLILGVGNLVENTVLHASIQNSHRASILSCISLAIKAGGLVTSFLGGIILKNTEIAIIWLVAPIVSIFIIACIIYKFDLSA